jgi:hypothetical protein
VDQKFVDRFAGFDVVGETRRFIFALAERHHLRVEWVDDPNYDLYCEIAPQRGLALDLWFSLSENSVRFGQRDWSANFHKIERVENWTRARRAFEGLITGQTRVALSYSPGRKQPFSTSVELMEGRDWRDVSSGLGLAVPPVYRTVYRYNGQEEAGPRGIARGSFVTLAALAAGLWWLFA